MVAAKRSDTIGTCVKKMISADVRHLPVIDDHTGEVFGLISVKASHAARHWFCPCSVVLYTAQRYRGFVSVWSIG